MHTDTREKLLKLIDKYDKVRPADLYSKLGISPQALHRHLKTLVKDGTIEAIGSSPSTQYRIAGTPDLEKVSRWLNSPHLQHNPSEFVCETRSALGGRLPHLKSFLKKGLSPATLPLVISVAGEIGNNSFDHNLGQWRDVPGCWFESQATGKGLWICIADRGQGVYASLAKVHPELSNEQEALQAAFETIISGRAPEQRGNGLKFVKQNISSVPGSGIACISGGARVSYGEEGPRCLELLNKQFQHIDGTVALMVWRIL